MIYEEASTSPLVDPRRIRETYILILVAQTRPDKGVTELYDDPNDVFRIVAVPLYTGYVEATCTNGQGMILHEENRGKKIKCVNPRRFVYEKIDFGDLSSMLEFSRSQIE
ncbi:hypothetical protein K0M31_005714 [Melipona bicolor]|uniref:Uncharacterized protein n=1 Tax=Melipona bicolor TaxID=60889 RepID=A0AA40FUP4_9HYME|nr:hypothetical protein K0M31_005714 [Melipona bicolor]